MIKIIFFGTPELAASCLEKCIENKEIHVSACVTQADKPQGRGKVYTSSPVKNLAGKHNISLYQPEKIKKNEDFFQILRSYEAHYFVVVAYGKILPQVILDIPLGGCINVHGSLLPQYRGASPLQAALLAGDTETGITIMKMSAGMDDGPILSKKSIPLTKKDTIKTLFEKFQIASPDFLVSTLLRYHSKKVFETPQDHTLASTCGLIKKSDGHINFLLPAQTLFNKWRAYLLWPEIYHFFCGKKLVFTSCEYLEDISLVSSDSKKKYSFGQVVCLSEIFSETFGTKTKNNLCLGVVCGNYTILILKKLKLEGKQACNTHEFLRGYPHIKNYVFHSK